ncbi:hypothetical protein QN277_013411 [Acacia crassicarpa]|uniref:Uncharacterized protein n=1 Tax=Acacia crassicarpa TaxID=499986 RepID=A0AAE1TFR1_9FABA|nr:hypothetical protein QN277_013411 [Acacia crassicarpa]
MAQPAILNSNWRANPLMRSSMMFIENINPIVFPVIKRINCNLFFVAKIDFPGNCLISVVVSVVAGEGAPLARGSVVVPVAAGEGAPLARPPVSSSCQTPPGGLSAA